MPVEFESLSSADARAQLARIQGSKLFRTSSLLCTLLDYLAEKAMDGVGGDLTEYTIGVECLGKPDSFDPREESIVRMHTFRIRQKLTEYYGTVGAGDPIVVELPKGGFNLTFAVRRRDGEPDTVTVAFPDEGPESFRVRLSRENLLVGVLVLMILCAGALLVRLWWLEWNGHPGYRDTTSDWTPALRELWDPFLSSERRLVLCVATPLFVEMPGFGLVREQATDDWGEVAQSKRLNSLEGALHTGITVPSYSYTEIGTATGAFVLGQFLAPRKKDVLVTRANVMSWQEIAEENVIFLGPSTGIRQMEDLPMDPPLVLDSAGVRNLFPKSGEPTGIYDRPARNGAEASTSYALVTRAPAMNGPGAVLMLSGNETASVMGAVQTFTNPTLAANLVSRLQTPSGNIPKYFQAVLSVKAMDDVPISIEYVLHRVLPVPDPRSDKKQ